jgi:palmitoyl-protein thioesterase
MGPAGYCKDQYKLETYLKASSFLAWFSNERSINQYYIQAYNKLTWFVQLKFTQDETVIPFESSWFGYFANNSEVMVQYPTLPDYQFNFLGFRDMDASGKIVRFSLDAGHCKVNEDWFTDNVLPYLM